MLTCSPSAAVTLLEMLATCFALRSRTVDAAAQYVVRLGVCPPLPARRHPVEMLTGFQNRRQALNGYVHTPIRGSRYGLEGDLRYPVEPPEAGWRGSFRRIPVAGLAPPCRAFLVPTSSRILASR